MQFISAIILILGLELLQEALSAIVNAQCQYPYIFTFSMPIPSSVLLLALFTKQNTALYKTVFGK